MVVFIHTADTHLGFRWDKDSRDDWFELQRVRWYENDIYSRWKDVLNYTITNKDRIDFIIHAGDIFHVPFASNPSTPPEPARRVLVETLSNFFKKTGETIPIIAIDGNHGVYQGYRYSPMESILTAFPGLISYYSIWDLKKSISENKPLVHKIPSKHVNLYLFPYFDYTQSKDYQHAYEEWLENQRPSGEEINIAIVHGSTIDETMHPRILSFDYDYFALGHEHGYREISKRAYYPGSLAPVTFGEIGAENTFLEVRISNKSEEPFVIKNALVQNREISVIQVDIKPAMSTAEIVSLVKRELEKFKAVEWDGNTAAILKVIFSGATSLKQFWGLEAELDNLKAQILNGHEYNVLQLRIEQKNLQKQVEMTPAAKIVDEYILKDPKQEFLEFVKTKVKAEDGYEMDLLTDIAMDAINAALKKRGGVSSDDSEKA
ncbi:MAG: exonuclease SbcCD subunit D [Candidatus Sigynarchaeota archaeon]